MQRKVEIQQAVAGLLFGGLPSSDLTVRPARVLGKEREFTGLYGLAKQIRFRENSRFR